MPTKPDKPIPDDEPPKFGAVIQRSIYLLHQEMVRLLPFVGPVSIRFALASRLSFFFLVKLQEITTA
jgi:hypothetical protein